MTPTLNPSPELVRAALALQAVLRADTASTVYNVTATPYAVTLQGDGAITDGPGVEDRGEWRTLRLGDVLDELVLIGPAPLLACPHGVAGPSCSSCLHEGDDPDPDDHRDFAAAHAAGPAPGWVGDLSRERIEDGRQP